MDLLLDEVAAIDFLSDGMLHLNAGVHLHEVEVFALVIDEVLDGSSVLVADFLHQLHSRLAHALAHLWGNFRR